MEMEMIRAALAGLARRLFAQRPSAYRRLARGPVLALLIAPFAVVGQAEADCTPASTVKNATVTCTGTTTGDPTGFGTTADDNNTYNIVAGATVTGAQTGLQFGTGATFNISGTIASRIDGSGIVGLDATINNLSTGRIVGGAPASAL